MPKDITTDLDGNPRFADDPCTENTGNGDPPNVDMGAYEFQGSSCDLDGDGDVDAADLDSTAGSLGSVTATADCNRPQGTNHPNKRSETRVIGQSPRPCESSASGTADRKFQAGVIRRDRIGSEARDCR